MVRLLSRVVLGTVVAGSIFAASATGQVTPADVPQSQNVVTNPPDSQPMNAQPAHGQPAHVQPDVEPGNAQPGNVQPSGVQPTNETARVSDESEATIDPASLLPDLPSLPKAKASLVGGTIGKLDRVRDQVTVQVFGGGKMKIAFDTRTHIYHDGKETSASDLRQGDRVYVETILDGSTVFARTIRLKTSATAGESQGIITSYRADKGELQMRDALSPRTIKIRVTPQTQIVEGDHAASTARLEPGMLVAVKFGARHDGGESAREVSILAVPGASFTFGGIVTAVDLRLGLLVLTSSTDHKTYEISIDPSLAGLDENLRPSANVTVLTRFEGNKYVARSLTVNSQAR